jgi:hypothetical protein
VQGRAPQATSWARARILFSHLDRSRPDHCQPLIWIQRLHDFSARTKLMTRPHRQTLAHSPLSFSLRRMRGSEGHHRRFGRPTRYSSQGRESGQWRRLEPLASVRAHWEGNRAGGAVLSPSPVYAPTVGWTRRYRAASWQRLISRTHHRSGGRGLHRDLLHHVLTHKRRNGEILIPTTRRRAIVRVLPARRTEQ